MLVACERSGVVRDAFAARGHDAWSCDVVPCERGGKHITDSVLSHDVVNRGWDLLIAHPECTFLTVAAARYMAVPWRAEAMMASVYFVRALWAMPVRRVAIENPVGRLSTLWMRPTQTIQPYQFGHDASKGTCLWLRGLPKLRPTSFVEPRMVGDRPRWANQTDSGQNRLPPSETRAMERARTYEGIANAMAEQWAA